MKMKNAMDSLERVSCVLEHKIPDRVPVALHNFLMTGRFIGCSDLSSCSRTAV